MVVHHDVTAVDFERGFTCGLRQIARGDPQRVAECIERDDLVANERREVDATITDGDDFCPVPGNALEKLVTR